MLDGASEVSIDHDEVDFLHEGPVDALIGLAARHRLEEFVVRPVGLTELFLGYYEEHREPSPVLDLASRSTPEPHPSETDGGRPGESEPQEVADAR